MKLLVAIVQADDAAPVVAALVRAHLYATTIASSGGFLREGNATILVGLEDRALPTALDIFAAHCERRVSPVPPDIQELQDAAAEWPLPDVVTVEVGGAVIFVVGVARFEQFR